MNKAVAVSLLNKLKIESKKICHNNVQKSHYGKSLIPVYEGNANLQNGILTKNRLIFNHNFNNTLRIRE